MIRTEQHTYVTQVDGRGVVHVDDLYATDPQDLWEAVTDPARLARWLVTVTGDLRVGGEITTAFTSGAQDPARITACEPPRRLVVEFAKGDDEATTIEATLTPEAGGTRLVVEEGGFDLDRAPFHEAGWGVHLDDLAAHLRGEECEPWKPRWEARLQRAQL
ncbi:SRPBCC domain-containing protein [Allobranchiibius sp. GilTou73]|uniref:SRPBCC domain-containing protein n=1 Tax=Allobranchiibius sp. GilTou73 TaxID=2904523 RepID=UPI001F43D1FD|nr:SRPBCC domain-containing protein [Allobranchiibius sp. GilTou73]UIJ33795.1 SRPBCC domain-containing protein [Allobranchiibius sp. GilTou73]